MAAGFAESYIRLWSLKGEKLRGFRSDFQTSSIKDGTDAPTTLERPLRIWFCQALLSTRFEKKKVAQRGN